MSSHTGTVRIVLARTTKFGRITHVRAGRIYRGSVTPLSQGGGAPALPNFGFPFYLQFAYILWRKATEFRREEGFVLWISVAPTPWIPSQRSPILGLMGTPCQIWRGNTIPRERSCGCPIIGVILYLCLPPLTQNDQIRHDNSREGRVFRRSATSLYLHKCIARFVGDSWGSCS